MMTGLSWLHEQLLNCPSKDMEITLDGKDLSGEYILLEVMNIQHIGPSLHLAPDANPGDGLLEVVLVSAGERDKFGAYLANCLAGNSYPMSWNVPRGQHLRLRWDGSDMHIDDKVWPDRDSTFSSAPLVLDIKANPRALEFLVSPAAC